MAKFIGETAMDIKTGKLLPKGSVHLVTRVDHQPSTDYYGNPCSCWLHLVGYTTSARADYFRPITKTKEEPKRKVRELV